MKIFLSLVCLTIGGIVVETVGVRLKRASGGKLVSIEDVPYVVSLRRRIHVCSGAFISTQHVLTAAHCVLDKSFRRLYTTRVISGTDKPDRTDVGHEIGEIIPHDEFLRGKSSCDIAVVKLVHFVWNGMQNQMELPNAGPRGIVFATFTGFQLRSSKRSVTGLQELNVKTRPIIPTSNNTYDSDQIFYGTFGYAQRINNDDIGGALVYERKIIGIVFKIPEKNKNACYFINVAKFKTFIEKSMDRSSNLERQSLVHFVWNGMQNQMELPNAGPRGIVFATFTGFQLRSSKRSVTGLQELNVKTRPIIPTSNNTYDSDQIFYGTFGYAQRINNDDIGGALVYERKIIGIVFKIPEKNKNACYFINVAKFKTFIEKSMDRSSNLERQSVILWAPKRPRF